MDDSEYHGPHGKKGDKEKIIGKNIKLGIRKSEENDFAIANIKCLQV